MADDEESRSSEAVDLQAVNNKPALEAVALPVSMVMVQLFTLVMLLLSKLALNTGMRPLVLLVYRNLVATAAIAPLAFIFERYTGLQQFLTSFTHSSPSPPTYLHSCCIIVHHILTDFWFEPTKLNTLLVVCINSSVNNSQDFHSP